jgi:uncharacterized protein
MKFDRDPLGDRHLFTGYGPGYVMIGALRLERSSLVTARAVEDWPVASVGTLETAQVEQILGAKAEIVLLGSGARFAFPDPAVLAPLYAARIGVEVMDTPAACRTFNILAGEGRNVVAALVID